MYSRLYTNVLNQYYRVDYCAGFHHCYADSGEHTLTHSSF